MLSNEQVQLKRTLRQQLVAENVILNFATLENTAGKLASILFPSLEEAEIAEVVAILTSEHTVTLNPGGTIVDPETFESWIDERKKTQETPRWDAYQQLLVQRDWDEPVIRDLAKQTDEIVELLGDPMKSGSWNRHGLLMGEVQSGKTATYLGVVNKAFDYGYRLVIVIGGHTNELRRQTQLRFDTDLFGIDSEYLDDSIGNVKLPVTGIGLIDPSLQTNVLTTVRRDFNANMARAGMAWVNSHTPTAFVIKKNARLIDNVSKYIRQQAASGVIDIPLLLIDDEADWGTPNVRAENDPAAVNKAIRKLLASSSRSSYLGITATPFANVFIDHEAEHDEQKDVFPKDYIRVMSTNSKYVGIDQYFRPHHGCIRTDVVDCTDQLPITHDRTGRLDHLPSSLSRALEVFILGTGIRRIRNEGLRPASMLINISRFNDVQENVADLTKAFLARVQSIIKAEFSLPTGSKHSPTYSSLFDAFQEEFSSVDSLTWDDVKSALLSTAEGSDFELIDNFKVELVNSKTAAERRRNRKLLSAEQRKAEDLRPTIYVGGDVLSRGLTLDGLQVSYFVREPRTMDTLMQMGRWFGYRPGYEDLVRIWIPQETAEDFTWSAESTSDLRELLLEMKARQLTPEQFGVRMRTHPDGFLIVAANKSRAATRIHSGAVLFEKRLEECWALPSDSEVQQNNLAATKTFIEELTRRTRNSSISDNKTVKNFTAWQNVPLEEVQAFLRKFRGAPNSTWWGSSSPTQAPQISLAVEDAKGSDFWDVILVSGNGSEIAYSSSISVKGSIRNQMTRQGPAIKLANYRVATATNLLDSLSAIESLRFKELYNAQTSDTSRVPTQKDVLGYIERPMLLIYGLVTNSDEASLTFTGSNPLISLAVAFPRLDPEEAIRRAENARTYLINTVEYRNLMGYQDEGDDVWDEEEN